MRTSYPESVEVAISSSDPDVSGHVVVGMSGSERGSEPIEAQRGIDYGIMWILCLTLFFMFHRSLSSLQIQ
jgi:hypothetical protein